MDIRTETRFLGYCYQ